MPSIDLDSDLLDYIVAQGYQPGDQLPTIKELQSAEHLGISSSKVREQLEVARALGLVEVRSRTGMRLKAYSFTPAVRLSLFLALASNLDDFEHFGVLRNHVEAAFWNEACAKLLPEDLEAMQACVDAALHKLNSDRVRIPHEEHRTFHLTVFKRLGNPFVMGLLEAYWDAYEAVAMNQYAEYSYLQQVWDYHSRILDAIRADDIDQARALFIEHTKLLTFPAHLHTDGWTPQAAESSKA
ncbi:MAG: FadR family transcriptional regulator [Chloroflexi bacterium]|nr:FadR family transcriptional regulator [Chloroflexota bacterium]